MIKSVETKPNPDKAKIKNLKRDIEYLWDQLAQVRSLKSADDEFCRKQAKAITGMSESIKELKVERRAGIKSLRMAADYIDRLDSENEKLKSLLKDYL